MGLSNIKAVAEAAGLSEDSLREAITSEEDVTLEVPTDRVVKTKEEFETYTANLKKEHGNASVEMAIKGVRNELGLDFKGKTMENLMGAYKEHILSEASVEPNEKITKLESELGEFRTKLEERNNSFTELENKYKREKDRKETSIISY